MKIIYHLQDLANTGTSQDCYSFARLSILQWDYINFQNRTLGFEPTIQKMSETQYDFQNDNDNPILKIMIILKFVTQAQQ